MSFSISVFGQELPKNRERLKELLVEIKTEDRKRENRVAKYMKSNNIENRFGNEENHNLFLYDIQNGQPQYLINHNDDSVTSLGVSDVREGGKLGLNLKGAGLNVAIWDGGRALTTHQEFGDRLKNVDTDIITFSDHSTHVMGTLLAEGIRGNAKGFLPEANAKAFDFNNDAQEIIDEILNNELLLSNHSYGQGAGWNNGVWIGDTSLSEDEDARFGYYDNNSNSIDQILYNAPYYNLFKSAGNHRNESGDGSHPADGPYDCINDFGLSKNVFCIGAVLKLNGEYSGPADVRMSSFSSWGPTDDGRIKPDFVAPGVNLFSSESANESSYGSQSGTSMASPSAAGGLGLVNEAYKLFNNNFLRSSTLKALTIHTIREAGDEEGPDYEFGWGLIDVSAAVDFIINNDGISKFIVEETLRNNQTFEMEINTTGNEPIVASLAWTDPAGRPVALSLDPPDLMLVNDLDMRIVDEVGNEIMPYILNPSSPTISATKGDNFRDNVEKIYFPNPEPRKYFLRITHKGELTDGRQDFGLVLQFDSEEPGTENLYWVNGDGGWDSSSQWSANSGGNSSGLIPSQNSKLIFDDNSFSSQSGVVKMNEDFEVSGIVALNSKNIEFDLGGNELTITGSTLIASPNFTFKNGLIRFQNDNPSREFRIDLNESKFENTSITFGEQNQALWIIEDDEFSLPSMTILNGAVSILNSNIEITSFQTDVAGSNNPTITLQNTSINGIGQLLIGSGAIWNDDANSKLIFDERFENSSTLIGNNKINSNVILNGGNLDFIGMNTQYNSVTIESGSLAMNGNISFTTLSLAPSTTFTINNGSQAFINSDISLRGEAGGEVSINGNGAINIEPHKKYCFDYLVIDNIDLLGESSISIGANSSLSNANGWSTKSCENLLFADFNVNYPCTGGLIIFDNTSDGSVESTEWFVDGESQSSDSDFQFWVPESQTLTVQIRVRSGEEESTYERVINIMDSEIPENRITQNSTQLASLQVADTYQWYKDYKPLSGETNRVYVYNGEIADYFVLTFSGDCNRISEVLVLTDVENIDFANNEIFTMTPNPFSNEIIFETKQNIASPIKIQIFNVFGEIVKEENLQLSNQQILINTGDLSAGAYIGVVHINDKIFSSKIIKHE